MSSAALQTAHHQHTALTSSPLGTPSSRQYRSSPSREAYHAQQATNTTPSSKRPPSRKNDSAPSPSYHLAPGFGSPITAANTAPEYESSTSERSSNMPPVAPPRTSSSQQSSSARRSNYSNERMTNSPRRGQAETSRTGSRGDVATTSNGHRSKNGTYAVQDPAAAPPISRDGKGNTTTMPIRSGQSTPSKQASENLIKAIANSESSTPRDRHAPQEDDAAPPPVVATNDQERRGGRSRHDHSRNHKATSKFGDFILGNTIGEGEFGKVKLGWKQDSSVQVRSPCPLFQTTLLTDSSGCYQAH